MLEYNQTFMYDYSSYSYFILTLNQGGYWVYELEIKNNKDIAVHNSRCESKFQDNESAKSDGNSVAKSLINAFIDEGKNKE